MINDAGGKCYKTDTMLCTRAMRFSESYACRGFVTAMRTEVQLAVCLEAVCVEAERCAVFFSSPAGHLLVAALVVLCAFLLARLHQPHII